jgi:membrane-bound metal-dependent hydrolase YbcI (DUF457 family)
VIAGHFGFAAAVKSRETTVPLWALMLATVWLDVVFVPLLLTNVETIAPADGQTLGYGHMIIHADYTHSLVGAIVLSALFGAVAGWAWGRRAGIVLGLVVFSHWVLDLVVHRFDMPILPANLGNLPRLGFGLWQVPLLSVAIELLLVVVGGAMYWAAVRRLPQSGGRVGMVSAILVLAGGAAVLALDFTGILG